MVKLIDRSACRYSYMGFISPLAFIETGNSFLTL